jgi:predicted MPP superfamily phosphohydrolase
MKLGINILSIGDVHGIDEWTIPTFGGLKSFDVWQEDKSKDDIYPFQEYDKVIFIGDYVDSYNKTNLEILHNLKNIITFKRAYPDKVILLIGNHDIYYFYHNTTSWCEGHRSEAFHDLHYLFYDNKNLFQLAFKYKNWLWTHAGVTKSFLDECINPMLHENYKYYRFAKDLEIDGLLNLMLEVNNPDMYNIGIASGGSSLIPSPIWARPKELDLDPIMFNQVVGHTNYKEIFTVNLAHISKEFEDITHIYIDCLPSKQWLIQKDI